ncbi:MAG: hypothetical protein FJX51_00130 [Alphaproteobacteria bacterium]|nr:hypothetical protein [Alphaproteobacteria bacterium]
MTLVLSVGGARVEIGLDIARTPRTVRALVSALPRRIDLHCAKIAGDQVLWPAPFVLPLEAARDIQGSPPGAFIYYPKRQFLEIMFGPLQDETASVTVLGQVTKGLADLKRIGRRVQTDQGWRPTWADLSAKPGPWQAELEKHYATTSHLSGEVDPVADERASRALQAARAQRRAAWSGLPKEFERLRARQGVMLPLGPLVFAESELRKLHENLWVLREDGGEGRGRVASLLARGAAAQLDGLLGLHETARTLGILAEALRSDAPDAPAVLDEAILAVGRLSHWLDLFFPWTKLNAVAAKAARGRFSVPAPRGGTTRKAPAPRSRGRTGKTRRASRRR